jgi:hypothetical protein
VARAEAEAEVARVAGTGSPALRDWTLRLFETSPVGPLGTGLALVGAYLALATAFRALAHALAPAASLASPAFRWEVVTGLLIALPLALNARARRAALSDLRDLSRHLDAGEAELARLGGEIADAPAAGLAWASGTSVAVMVLVVLFDPAIWGGAARPGALDPWLYLAIARNAASAYAFGRMLALEAALTRGYRRLAGRVRIDLFDPEALAPFGRKGQRSAFAWILYSSCVSLFFFGGQPSTINGLVLVLVLAVVVAAFALPLSRLRARILAAKRAEIRRLDLELARERAALLAGSAPAPGRVADLVAWRTLVEAVREWPIGAPTLVRSGLFVLVGIGSWLGGAVVERLLEAALPH